MDVQILVNAQTFASMAGDVALLLEENKACANRKDKLANESPREILVNAQTFARMAGDIALLSEDKKTCAIEKDNLTNEKQYLSNEIARLKATVAALKGHDTAEFVSLFLPETGDESVTGRRLDGQLAKFTAASSDSVWDPRAMAFGEPTHELFDIHNDVPDITLNIDGKLSFFSLDMSVFCALRSDLTVATETAANATHHQIHHHHY
jgi:hypothetical protein